MAGGVIMPTYVYSCPNGHEIELFHAIGECNQPHYCVKCNKEMRRIPQRMTFYRPPGAVLLEKMEQAFYDKKARNDKWRQRKAQGKVI